MRVLLENITFQSSLVLVGQKWLYMIEWKVAWLAAMLADEGGGTPGVPWK